MRCYIPTLMHWKHDDIDEFQNYQHSQKKRVQIIQPKNPVQIV